MKGFVSLAPRGRVHVLVPVKEESDALYGARYSGNLIGWGVPVRATLLHVSAPAHGRRRLLSSQTSDRQVQEARAAAVVRHACQRFAEYGIPHGSCVVSGDVAFSILDMAELLNCHEIVLHRPVGGWPRAFSCDIAGEVARAVRSVPVVIVDDNGLVVQTAER